MSDGRGWRWAALGLIAASAGLFAAFNTGERVALNLGFTMLYRLPLVPLIFLAFLAGMATMFLIGLRHDLRVRRALRDAGFGVPAAHRSRTEANAAGGTPEGEVTPRDLENGSAAERLSEYPATEDRESPLRHEPPPADSRPAAEAAWIPPSAGEEAGDAEHSSPPVHRPVQEPRDPP